MFVYLAVGAGVVIIGALVARRRQAKKVTAQLPADAAGGRPAEGQNDDAPGHWLIGGPEGGGGAGGDPTGKKASKSQEAKKAKKAKGRDAEADDEIRARTGGPRGLRVGDVLLYADTELWLAGEMHLDEEGFALSLFITPGGVRASHVVMLDAEGRDVAFVSETDEVPDGAIPTELPVGGLRLSLWRRGQAAVRTEGEHLPLVSERATYAILRGPGGRLLVIVDHAGGDRIALLGERVTPEFYDVLPGG